MNRRAGTKNGKCLSTQYINSKTKLLWECAEGHQWEAAPGDIKQGHWFKLPPGWSLIEVAPVCDEDLWGGKRWLDARPFDWGYSGDSGKYKSIQQRFNFIYYLAAKEYLLKLKKQLDFLVYFY